MQAWECLLIKEARRLLERKPNWGRTEVVERWGWRRQRRWRRWLSRSCTNLMHSPLLLSVQIPIAAHLAVELETTHLMDAELRFALVH